MKIRCTKCYKVLKKNEEYCTHCGTHSDEVMNYMAQDKHELDSLAKFKLALIIFLAVAFVGTGVLMVSFAIIQNKNYGTYDMNTCKAISFFITSIVLFIVLILTNFKDLKTMIYNGNGNQLLGSFLIACLTIAILVILNYLSLNTRMISNYVIDFINDNIYFSVEGTWMTTTTLFIALVLGVFSEEIVFRKRLIDMLDDETLWSDIVIVIVSALLTTFLDFLWVMSTETVLCMFILNLVCSGIYIYTNRSLSVNIIMRILIICLIFII